MQCDQCRDKLGDLYEGRLSADELASVRGHLQACARCAEEYRQLVMTVQAVRDLGKVTPPAGLLDRVSRALDSAESPVPLARRVVRLGPLLAAAACFVIIVVGLVRHHQQGAITDLAPLQQPPVVESLTDMPLAVPEPAIAPPPVGTDEDDESVAGSAPGIGAPDPAAVVSPEPMPDVAEPRPPDRVRPAQGPSDRLARPTRRSETVTTARDRHIQPPRATAEEGVHEPPTPVPLPSAPVKEAPVKSASDTVRLMMTQPETADTRYFDLSEASRGAPTRMLPPAPMQDTGKLSVRFVPPQVRQVGKPAVCALVLTSDRDLAEVTVRVESRRHLRLPGLDGDKLYRGPLTASVPKQLEFKIIGEEEGTQRMRVSVETPISGLEAQMEVVLPGFESAPAQKEANPLGEPITLVFRDVPIRQALLQIARKGGVSLVLGAGIGGHRVNYSCTDTPAGSVIRVLADTYGYDVQFTDGTYHIRGRPSDGGQ